MRTALIAIICLLSLDSLYAQNDLVNDFLQALKSKKSFSYEMKQVVIGMSSATRSAKCSFLLVPEDTSIGAYYNFTTDNSIVVYNGVEYMDYDEECTGKDYIRLISRKKDPQEFNDGKIVMGEVTYYTLSRIKSSVFYDESPMNLVQEFKELRDNKYDILEDTTIAGYNCSRIKYLIHDTVVDGQREITTFTAAFDKISKMPVFTYFYHPMQQRETIFHSYTFDNVDKKLFTRKAFPKGLKFTNNPPKTNKKKKLPVGQPVPEFTLKNMDDKEISLKDLKGKIVLLDFSFIGCTGCELAIPDLNTISKKYTDVVVLGIYPKDSKEYLAKHIKKKGIVYDILPATKELAKSYGVTSYPTFFILDGNGILLKRDSGWGEGALKPMEEELEKALKGNI